MEGQESRPAVRRPAERAVFGRVARPGSDRRGGQRFEGRRGVSTQTQRAQGHPVRGREGGQQLCEAAVGGD